jgi:hypothetical protein
LDAVCIATIAADLIPIVTIFARSHDVISAGCHGAVWIAAIIVSGVCIVAFFIDVIRHAIPAKLKEARDSAAISIKEVTVVALFSGHSVNEAIAARFVSLAIRAASITWDCVAIIAAFSGVDGTITTIEVIAVDAADRENFIDADPIPGWIAAKRVSRTNLGDTRIAAIREVGSVGADSVSARFLDTACIATVAAGVISVVALFAWGDNAISAACHGAVIIAAIVIGGVGIITLFEGVVLYAVAAKFNQAKIIAAVIVAKVAIVALFANRKVREAIAADFVSLAIPSATIAKYCVAIVADLAWIESAVSTGEVVTINATNRLDFTDTDPIPGRSTAEGICRTYLRDARVTAAD